MLSRYSALAFSKSLVAIATWLSLPIHSSTTARRVIGFLPHASWPPGARRGGTSSDNDRRRPFCACAPVVPPRCGPLQAPGSECLQSGSAGSAADAALASSTRVMAISPGNRPWRGGSWFRPAPSATTPVRPGKSVPTALRQSIRRGRAPGGKAGRWRGPEPRAPAAIWPAAHGSARWRSSPCTGTAMRGRVQPYIWVSSSRAGWPLNMDEMVQLGQHFHAQGGKLVVQLEDGNLVAGNDAAGKKSTASPLPRRTLG